MKAYSNLTFTKYSNSLPLCILLICLIKFSIEAKLPNDIKTIYKTSNINNFSQNQVKPETQSITNDFIRTNSIKNVFFSNEARKTSKSNLFKNTVKNEFSHTLKQTNNTFEADVIPVPIDNTDLVLKQNLAKGNLDLSPPQETSSNNNNENENKNSNAKLENQVIFELNGKEVLVNSNPRGTSYEVISLMKKSKEDAKASCIDNCNSNGYCINGSCICKPGFKGASCENSVLKKNLNNDYIECPNSCNFKGICNLNGLCSCEEGYTGEDCSIKSNCINPNTKKRLLDKPNKNTLNTNKNNKGISNNTLKLSKQINDNKKVNFRIQIQNNLLEKYSNECSGNGECVSGSCVCYLNYHGEYCEISNKPCKDDCNNNGFCNDGECVCQDTFYGESCEKEIKSCSQHGLFSKETGRCTCDIGRYGDNCEFQKCSENCDKNGTCNINSGKCICNSGYTGYDCSVKKCPNDCNHKGKCLEGICVCESMFEGLDCSHRKCENNCYGHGECDNITMKCICEEKFFGDYCQDKVCSVQCLNGGTCINGECACKEGFGGEDCSSKSCLYNCNKNGDCDDGKCRCNEYFFGEFCEKRRCKNDCNIALDQGICNENNFKCICSLGYSGEDCSENICPNNCFNFDIDSSKDNNKRLKLNKESYINEMFLQVKEKNLAKKVEKLNSASRKTRVDALLNLNISKFNKNYENLSDNNNINHGECTINGCVCKEGFVGTDCALKVCPNDCSGNGDCDFNNGKCKCYPGYKGDDCSGKYCKDNCSNNGECQDDKCICKEGFEGSFCENKSCPANCNNNGVCDFSLGKCHCSKYFSGIDCSNQVCVNNCNSNGICLEKTLEDNSKSSYCQCLEGFFGDNCEKKKCKGDCLNSGTCNNNTGKCDCKDGFDGDTCNLKKCENNCNFNGKCDDGKCKCFEGFSGETCSESSCKNNCNFKGVCNNGKCMCVAGYFGEDCSKSL